MKILMTVLTLVVAATAWAQQPGMTPEMMQKCFASIDQKALAYGIQMSKDPELQKMRKCGEAFQSMAMPGSMPWTSREY